MVVQFTLHKGVETENIYGTESIFNPVDPVNPV